MNRSQLTFEGMARSSESTAPDGLRFLADAVTVDAEAALLHAIDGAEWSNALSRRVQHYGWRYDYKSRRVDASAYLGPLPAFLEASTEIVRAATGMTPTQAIVNEYLPGQGIAPHVDCEPCFGPVVAMIGLGSHAQMDFERRSDGARWELLFQRRGMLCLSGAARYEWTHGIAKRRNDPLAVAARQRRISITFRTVVR